jgi:hypothetical protein
MIQMTQKIFAAFLFIVTILLSPLTIASTSTVEGYRVISVSCTLPKDESVHRFQAIGLLSIDDLGFVKGTFSIQLLKGTEIRSVMQYNDLEVTGTFEQ